MIAGLNKLLAGSGQPGLVELRHVLQDLLGGPEATGMLCPATGIQPMTSRVYRLRFELTGRARSVIIKRLEPDIARRDQLVSTCWLPAVGLANHGPGWLATAAERSGQCVWLVYEDWGDWTLAAESELLPRVKAAVELIAQIHLRFADHPLLPECRLHGGDLGMSFYAANVRDAIRSLKQLRHSGASGLPAHAELIERLLARLHGLCEEGAERAQALEELAGTETLLHGDLWTTNTFVVPTDTGLHARLIDWDHAGVGPISYDLSTFLLRFARERRWPVLELYRQALWAAGWRLPPVRQLNYLFETAEYARFANRIIWPALDLMRGCTQWGFEALAEVEQWFEDFRPVLPEEHPSLLAQTVAQ